VTPEEAAALLGVEVGAGPPEVRSAFRRRLRVHHPDVAGAAGAVPTRDLITAYRVLGSVGPEPSPLPAAEPGAAPVAAGIVGHGATLHLVVGPRHVFDALMDVAHGLGEIGHVDRLCGFVETIVDFDGYPACSVLCGVERGRFGGTDVEVMVESLTGGGTPTDEAVAALVAERLGEALISGGAPPHTH
jgi:hypothetical protein